MLDLFRTVFGVLVLALNTLTPRQADARQPQDAEAVLEVQARPTTTGRPIVRRQLPEGARTRALRFARTELYFGTAMSEGPVTEAQFQDFVDREVTPRFPDGLTITKADGRFRTEDGLPTANLPEAVARPAPAPPAPEVQRQPSGTATPAGNLRSVFVAGALIAELAAAGCPEIVGVAVRRASTW